MEIRRKYTLRARETHHQSNVAPSWPITCKHKDLWAHQSNLTDLRQAEPLITDLGTHLPVNHRSLKAVHATWRSVEHRARPTCHWTHSSLASTCWLLIGCRRRFREAQATSPVKHPWFPPINSRGWVEMRTHFTFNLHSLLEFRYHLGGLVLPM